jgi:von Willebrand factor type A C-terminal domain/von Willebrand factor type A domain
MVSGTEFSVEVFQNEYLPSGARGVNAIVTVTSAGAADWAVASRPGAAEIIIIDCSGSMGSPQSKIIQARQAACAAIDVIADGTAFAVISGADDARPLYPADGTMATADSATREAAANAARRLQARGGTEMSTWLRLARQIFGTGDEELRHAILLTDGQNVEQAGKLPAEVARCEGVFSCDCRGVGTDWKVAELRDVATTLLGTVDIVPEPDGLVADFEEMMAASMAKEVAEVTVRVWTPAHGTIRFLRQVAPALENLTRRRADVSAQIGDYPTGAWGSESRDYHLCVDVRPAELGDQMLAARVSVMLPGEFGQQVAGSGRVLAIWTDEEELSTQLNGKVAHYGGQAELVQAIQEGLAARKAGDKVLATARLGRAVALAHASGNQDTARLLAEVVEVADAPSGTVRLRTRVADADEMALDTKSTKTIRART